MEDNKENTPSDKDGKKQSLNFYWVYGIIGFVLLGMLVLNSGQDGSQIQWAEFTQYIEKGEVKRVVFDGRRATILLKDGIREDMNSNESDQSLLNTVYRSSDFWLNIPLGDAYLADLKEQRAVRYSILENPKRNCLKKAKGLTLTSETWRVWMERKKNWKKLLRF